MIYLRSHTIRTRNGANGRRGSVIVLVVAVLALLAVIGTIYIISARAERGSAISAQSAANLDNAQKAVNDMVVRVIGDSILDEEGRVGGLAAGTPRSVFGNHIARRYDIPEGNPDVLLLGNLGGPAGYPASANGPFSTAHNPLVRDGSWLVDSIYRFNSGVFNPYAGIYPVAGGPQADRRWKSTSLITAALFDPSTGVYDIPIYQLPTFHGPGPTDNLYENPNFSSANMFNVVADPSQLPTLNMPNGVPTSADADSYINLLPFSDASGIRYRFGIRIVDTSSMANLNVGMTSTTISNTVGTYFNDYMLDTPTIFNSAATLASAADDPGSIMAYKGLAANIGPNNAGRLGMFNPGVASPEYGWTSAVFRFENISVFGNSVPAPFDAIDELELRSYGNLGTMATARPAMGTSSLPVWPNTLGNRNLVTSPSVVSGNPFRGYYTAHSYTRALRPYPDPVNGAGILTAYQVTPPGGVFAGGATYSPPSGGTYVFPVYPAPVAANPDVSAYTGVAAPQSADRLVVAATNIATLLDDPNIGFNSHPDACSFAANYLTYIWNGWSVNSTAKNLVTGSGTVATYTLPAGPSFVDDTGICVRVYDSGAVAARDYGSAADLHAETVGKVYLGYAAQPFINEVTETQETVDPGGGAPFTKSVTDWAVELYNPYNLNLSLKGYKLRLGGTDIDLSTNGTDELYVPARGYLVVCKAGGTISTTKVDTTAAVKFETSSGTLDGINDIYLMRPYTARSGPALGALGAVDHYDITSMTLNPPDTAIGDKNYYERRPNSDTNTADPVLQDRWQAVYETTDSKAMHLEDTDMTLGKNNTVADATLTPVPLYDRYLDDPTVVQRTVLRNISEFNKIMRISNQIDATNVGLPLVPDGTIAMQMVARDTLSKAAPFFTTDFPMDATIHFDFRSEPITYGGAGAPTLYKGGDARAGRLLESLAFTDRVSEFSIDLGDNNPNDRGISKLRIPGLINVNTASPEVLATIPALAIPANQKYIGVILAYRWRTNTADPRIPVVLQSGLANFSNPAEFPGYGIRSLGELQVAITYAQKGAGATPKTLLERDTLWAQVYNMLTVRSDTFVLYAYLEAVKLNPRYNGAVAHNNSTDWYLNSGGAITDDPGAAGAGSPMLRVGRRRWVALIDRSQANFSRYMEVAGPTFILDPRFTQPRIVAAKDLGQ